jgi:hypothetical protein
MKKRLSGQAFPKLGYILSALFYFGSDDSNMLKIDIMRT